MKPLYKVLFVMHVFICIGALAGGYSAMADPYNPLGAPAEILKNAPFDNFFIPGVILFSVIGVGNIACALLMLLKWRFIGYSSGVAGGALVIWIVVQCIMIWTVSFLHVIFFIYGLVQTALALYILNERGQFPMNIITDMSRKLRKADA